MCDFYSPASLLIFCSCCVKFLRASSLTVRCGAKQATAHTRTSTPVKNCFPRMSHTPWLGSACCLVLPPYCSFGGGRTRPRTCQEHIYILKYFFNIFLPTSSESIRLLSCLNSHPCILVHLFMFVVWNWIAHKQFSLTTYTNQSPHFPLITTPSFHYQALQMLPSYHSMDLFIHIMCQSNIPPSLQCLLSAQTPACMGRCWSQLSGPGCWSPSPCQVQIWQWPWSLWRSACQ